MLSASFRYVSVNRSMSSAYSNINSVISGILLETPGAFGATTFGDEGFVLPAILKVIVFSVRPLLRRFSL